MQPALRSVAGPAQALHMDAGGVAELLPRRFRDPIARLVGWTWPGLDDPGRDLAGWRVDIFAADDAHGEGAEPVVVLPERHRIAAALLQRQRGEGQAPQISVPGWTVQRNVDRDRARRRLPVTADVVAIIAHSDPLPALFGPGLSALAIHADRQQRLAIDDEMIAHVEGAVPDLLVDDDIPYRLAVMSAAVIVCFVVPITVPPAVIS